VPRPKQRTPELRDRVLRVALDVLAEDGVAGLTTRAVAARAGTSVPAIYELFGDKAGLVRELFVEGFRRLADRMVAVGVTDDPRDDLLRLIAAYRRFVRDSPTLADVMFSKPFAAMGPGPDGVAAGVTAREAVVDAVRRAIDGGVVAGDPVDVAHVLLALAQGLVAQEAAGWLGRSPESVERRWALALDATLDGLRPGRPGPLTGTGDAASRGSRPTDSRNGPTLR
jgi:AcrR family transcriptional regulator